MPFLFSAFQFPTRDSAMSPAVPSTREVELTGGPPWGFRMAGGAGAPFRITRVGKENKQKKAREYWG